MTQLTECGLDWIQLLNPPFQASTMVKNISYWNEQELLFITYIDDHHLICASLTIWTYNIFNNDYKKLIASIYIHEDIENCTITLHDNKSVLYLFGESGQISKINLK
eukprot:83118_1